MLTHHRVEPGQRVRARFHEEAARCVGVGEERSPRQRESGMDTTEPSEWAGVRLPEGAEEARDSAGPDPGEGGEVAWSRCGEPRAAHGR